MRRSNLRLMVTAVAETPLAAPAGAVAAVAEVSLRLASPTEAEALTELAIRSKAVWGYDKAFMAACREELAVTAQDIADAGDRLTVAQRGGKLAGYSWVMPLSQDVWELEALFVEPAMMGQGIGLQLFRQAVKAGVAGAAVTLTVQSDPGAAAFYERAGCVRVGERESGSVAGRMLPFYHFTLPQMRRRRQGQD
jgi:ribosomal protein S18 acetylase RimI-like enzyme